MRDFVVSESAFFNAFLEEGLRFSSSMFLCLIWIRVLKHVFKYPDEAAKHLKNHPFFKKFVGSPTTEAYIEGLCDSLQSLCIGSPVQRPTVKRRLSEMLLDESSSDEDDTPVFRKSRYNIESEDDGLPGTSASYVDVTEGSPSHKKKSKKHKKAKKH